MNGFPRADPTGRVLHERLREESPTGGTDPCSLIFADTAVIAGATCAEHVLDARTHSALLVFGKHSNTGGTQPLSVVQVLYGRCIANMVGSPAGLH